MNNKLKIPKTINVGFQNRNGTYTGKLAYVIYTDEKGVLRKEGSWQSWRDQKIDPETFNNEPTSGFVLNKGVGGQRESWGWNARNEYIRVYDPRGFEFEISVANLLFILSESNSIKGKGLDGEFVYSWDGADLVLLPTNCFEYRSSVDFTSLQSKKVNKNEVKEGHTYKHKNTNQMIYLGRHKVRNFDRLWGKQKMLALTLPAQKAKHVFWDLTEKAFHFEDGFTKLGGIVSNESHPEFADLYTKLMESEFVSNDSQLVLTQVSPEEVSANSYSSYGRLFFIKVDGGYQLARVMDKRFYGGYGSYSYGRSNLPPDGQSETHFWPTDPYVVKEVTSAKLVELDDYRMEEHRRAVSTSFIQGKELFVPEIKLPTKTMRIEGYVERREDQPVS